MSQKSGIEFKDFFTHGQYETLEKPLKTLGGNKHLKIGIPCEKTMVENRVALVPESVRSIVGYEHEVWLESGAGLKSNYSDNSYSEAGAQIVYSAKEVYICDVIVKIAPPTLSELELFKGDQVLISPIHLPMLGEEYLKMLLKKRITALAMEYLQSNDGSYPLVRIVSEIAGTTAITTAAELLSQSDGRGILLGGVSGVPPAKVVILGAGVVGEFAVKAAVGLGASVRVFDNDITKLMRIQSAVGRQLHTSSINPVYLAYQLMSADVVIGAIHSPYGRTPILVTEEMVSKMKEGSVIVDISIDQGGCFETSEVTTLDKPVFVKHGVLHYCVPNITSKVSRTASKAVSNIITPLLVKLGEYHGIENILFNNPGIRHGCYTYKSCLTNEYLSKKFGMKYTSLDLLLTSTL
jgi:alanine dehydrogenase